MTTALGELGTSISAAALLVHLTCPMLAGHLAGHCAVHGTDVCTLVPMYGTLVYARKGWMVLRLNMHRHRGTGAVVIADDRIDVRPDRNLDGHRSGVA